MNRKAKQKVVTSSICGTGVCERFNVGKTQDDETGFYYFGARYLNPKTSMWISADPAMGEYVPAAPVDDEARKHNQSLPGMGGVFNYVNFHVYHYAGNNPVKYVDPDGKSDLWGFAVEIFKKEWNSFLTSLSNPDNLKKPTAELLRDGAKISEQISDKATIITAGSAAIGAAPIAATAAKIAVVSNLSRLGLNLLADILEGGFSDDSADSVKSVLVDIIVGSRSPIKYNSSAQRFQNKTGRFISNNEGNRRLIRDSLISFGLSSGEMNDSKIAIDEAIKKINERIE